MYCPTDINALSHNMLAFSDRHRCAVLDVPEQGSLPKAGFPASDKEIWRQGLTDNEQEQESRRLLSVMALLLQSFMIIH